VHKEGEQRKRQAEQQASQRAAAAKKQADEQAAKRKHDDEIAKRAEQTEIDAREQKAAAAELKDATAKKAVVTEQGVEADRVDKLAEAEKDKRQSTARWL